MIKKSIKIICITFSCFIYSCSQGNKEQKQNNTIQTKTEDMMISEIEQKVNSFSSRPYYSVDFDNSNSGCQFEILINDIPVAKKIGIGGALTSSAPINSCILNSGKQKLKIKLYPNIGKNQLTVSDKNTPLFTLSIAYRKDAWDYNDINEVLVFQLPSIPIPESGLPYFEKEFEFDAEVPYQFEGWSNSKDLTKVADIEQKVLDKYKEIQRLLANKDYSTFEKMKKQKDSEMNISFYLKPNEIIEGVKFDKDAFTEKNAVVQPLDNAKVVFYGYNRLVTLENISDKGSALRTKIKHEAKDGKVKEETIKFPILFHMSQNSDELEVIR
ncbi:hypothetical protein [Chryseobacterium jejuense]|uniref:Lipoprotein n=1 Tax=Chryseobacterium jejuense TaxID=445960 RepID=A0A2X2X1A7_CHRJE|nr:hypothetical protein [Chryseobacterium jejuense]SDI19340.1 hypothetical protein SAMN05421542_0380 [Chryseobacterium jejuense]SQB46648.1 Uncharacterised protein [Chryseobacterium jejuense]